MAHPLEHLKRLQPGHVGGDVRNLIDSTFLAYNAARLREACRLYADVFTGDDVTVGMSVAGALTPAGLGVSCLVPLMKAGLVDWLVFTGANLYHDLHFALGKPLHCGGIGLDDRELRRDGIVRIYDILFKDSVLFETDAYVRDFCDSLPSGTILGSAEFHYRLGEKLLGEFGENRDLSVLMTACELGVPLFTSSPGDSTLGMNLAEAVLKGRAINFDVALDVNQSAAIVYDAKKNGGSSAVCLLGGGSPKNFVLQTEPYIQEILMLKEKGHDYFMQFTDARPDTGGLSGATPQEAVSWGKIDPDRLPDSVVCYGDTTVYLPLLTAYVCAGDTHKKPRRLYDRLGAMVDVMKDDYLSRQ